MRSEMMKMLKNEAEKNTPDVYKKVMSAANEQYLFYELRREYHGNNGDNRRSKSAKGGGSAMVGLSATIVALALGTFAVFAIWGKQITSLLLPAATTFPMSDTYAVGAVSAVKLLDESVPEGAGSAAYEFTLNSGKIEENLKVFDRYFNAFDLFGGTQITVLNAAGEKGYAAKATVKTQNYYNTAFEYAMYFNESETEENSGKRAATGEIAVGGRSFALRGERRVNEDKRDEELLLKVFADGLDGKTFVQVESTPKGSADRNSLEYRYTLVVDGEVAETSALKTGGGVTYSFDVSGAFGGSYKVIRPADGSAVTVGYTVGGESGTFKVQPKDGGYDYVFTGAATTAKKIKFE
ncbi:MAG: hypothetical protein K2I20_03935 [Clostridia bacterium]|nr:hypothetical protein [Clostridia bacterium]